MRTEGSPHELWGIDLGGTKIEGVILNGAEPGKVITRLRLSTEREKGYPHIIERIAELVSLMEKKTGRLPERIGFGTPGTRDPVSRLMKNCNTTVLNDQPLKEDLEAALDLPVVIANDANCFAIAETRLGIVREKMPGARVVFGVIMGTGVGGGIIVDGRVINGRQGIGGEWGHNFLEDTGGPCYCGNTGCVETIISGPALERYYLSISGRKLGMEEIVARRLADEDAAARQTVDRLLHYFGKGIATVINILDPDVVILGGGLSNIGLLYTEGVRYAEKYVFNTHIDTVFLRPKLGDSAGVFGAALLVAE